MESETAIKVELAALRRRVEAMELICLGAVRKGPTKEQLVSLYIEASRAVSSGTIPEESLRGWSNAVMLLDEESLLTLVRELGDHAPWRPFFLLMESLREGGGDIAAARAHLRAVVRSFMDGQGLALVSVHDVIP